MDENSLLAKTKDVLPPFDPPGFTLSIGQMILLNTPMVLVGLLFLSSMFSPNSRPADVALRGCLVAAFFVIAMIGGILWGEIHRLSRELKQARQQLADVQEQ